MESQIHAFESNTFWIIKSLLVRRLISLMQKLKTGVVKDNCNPEWNEEFTLSIKDVKTPIHLVSTDASYITKRMSYTNLKNIYWYKAHPYWYRFDRINMNTYKKNKQGDYMFKFVSWFKINLNFLIFIEVISSI